jgi:P27 family predicted phage terminase small subunit
VGRRGPAPLPTKLRVLRGETRPSQVNRAEPEPRSGEPRMPDDLEPDAQAVWRRVLRDQAPGVIRAVDGDTLRLYCEALVRYRQSEALLRQSGPLLVDRHHGGAPVKNPLHQIVRDNALLVRQLAGELGLTPASRVGLREAGDGGTSASTLAQLRARHAARG